MIFPVGAKFGDLADHFVNKKRKEKKTFSGLARTGYGPPGSQSVCSPEVCCTH